jgi:thioredoxin-like negative regulator of GroEL
MIPLVLALTSLCAGDDAMTDFLPPRPEVVRIERDGTDPVFDVRCRDCKVIDVLTALTRDGRIPIVVDPLAEQPLRGTLVTVHLSGRGADEIVTLLSCAAGVDAERETSVYRIEGPPKPASNSERTSLWHNAERFYELALSHVRDDENAARAQRGLAELNRLVKDYVSAYSNYEALLSRFPRSDAAKNCEVLLADMYVKAGEKASAQTLLRQFLDRCTDHDVREEALRRFLDLLLEADRYRDLEDLRESFLAVGELSPDTLGALSQAASVLIEKGYHSSAVLLIQELWVRDPARNAVLGPVLALGLVAQNDIDAALAVLQMTVQNLENATTSASALLAFAEIAERTGRRQDALLFGHNVLLAQDRTPRIELRAHLLLFGAYRDIGLAQRARTHLYAAERLGGRDEGGELALQSAQLALDGGQPVQARLLFQEALQYETIAAQAELGIVRALIAGDESRRACAVLADLFSRNALPSGAYAMAVDLAVSALEKDGRFEDARRVLRGDVGVLDFAEDAR